MVFMYSLLYHSVVLYNFIYTINAYLHFQVRSICCCHLQNPCQPHYHSADSVVTSGCSFISQQIRNEILVVFAVLCKCIMIDKLSVGKRSMCIYISGGHTFCLRHFNSLIVTRPHGGPEGVLGINGVCFGGGPPVPFRIQHVY